MKLIQVPGSASQAPNSRRQYGNNRIGVYGTPGTPSANNIPGGRQEAAAWVDLNGNFWLFGGEGEDKNMPTTDNGILNDLWEYHPGTNQWTFVVGDTTANQTGEYEAQTVVGPVSTIGAASTCGLSVGLSITGNIVCSPVSTTGALHFPGRVGAPAPGPIMAETCGCSEDGAWIPREPTATAL